MTSDGVKIADIFKKAAAELTITENLKPRSITKEILTPIEGKLSGKIPEWLSGSLIINGPGQFTDSKLNHLFDGFSVWQKFNIKKDKITYQNKMLQSEAYIQTRENNQIMFGDIGTPAKSKGLFNRIMNIGKLKPADNAVVSIYPISDNYYAITETPSYHKIDPSNLDSLGRVDIGKKFKIFILTAHPHVMADGVAYNVGTSMNDSKCVYNVICFSKGEDVVEKAKVVAKVPARHKFHPSYMHSFGITEKYFIIFETPLVISLPTLIKATIFTPKGLNFMKWIKGELSRIILIDRETGTVRHTFYADPFFCFHTINAFEKNDEVIFDLVCFRNGSFVGSDDLMLENLAKENLERDRKFLSLPLRFVMPTVANDKNVNLLKFEGTSAKAILKDDGKIYLTPEVLCDFGSEFPRVNYPKYCGIEYKYFYIDGRDGSILKVDTTTKEKIFWKEENVFAWEPIFVPSPDAKEEDDGVLVVGYITSSSANQVGLVILNAKDLKEIARAEFNDLPSPITKPFHGWFIAEALN